MKKPSMRQPLMGAWGRGQRNDYPDCDRLGLPAVYNTWHPAPLISQALHISIVMWRATRVSSVNPPQHLAWLVDGPFVLLVLYTL